MATIPVYQRRVTQDGGASVTRVGGSDPIGNALQGMGQMGGRMADSFMAHALQEKAELERKQEEAKRKADKEAEDLAAVQVANVLSQGDVFWQQREDERRKAWKVGDPDMREGIGKDFDKWVEESKATLNTPSAQKYFMQNAASMRAKLQTNAYTFQRKAEFEKVNAETAAAEDADEINVAANWKDEKAVNAIIARRAETIMARTDIGDGDKTKEVTRLTRRMTLARERAYVENNPAEWLRTNGSRRAAPGTPTGEAPFDSLFAAVVQQESGGVHATGDGKLLTSSAGAQGVTQVMPATGTDPGYGVKPLQNQSREEYLRFGRDYLQAMIKEFDGDQAKALAAYNAGPGRVIDAVRSKGSDWLSVMPKETKDYVAKIGGKVGMQPAAEPQPGETDLQPKGMAARLDPDTVYQLRSLAETRVGQQQSQLRAEGQRLVSDLMAAHKDGKIEPQPLGREYFDRAFGADGVRAYADYQQSRTMGADIASYKTKPADQIVAEIAAGEPQPGDGYAAADARQNARKQAAAQVLQQRNADPVTYATSTSPRAAALAQQLQAENDPARRAALNAQFIEANLAEQQRLGVQSPRLLTPAQADRWQSIAMAAQRPEDSANLIATLETEYGKNFPRVFNELAREGKLSGELLVIPNLPSQAARETVSRLARVKESELAAAVAPEYVKDVKESVIKIMQEYAPTVPAINSQSVSTINNYETLLRKFALEQVKDGSSVSDAQKRARALLLGHYEFQGTVRVPKGVDYGVSKKAMDTILKDLQGVDVQPDEIGARKPEEARAFYTDIVKARPMWHTTDDDKGVQLFVVRDNGTKAPVTVGGKPVRKTWTELAAVPVEKAKERAEVNKKLIRVPPPTAFDNLQRARDSGELYGKP